MQIVILVLGVITIIVLSVGWANASGMLKRAQAENQRLKENEQSLQQKISALILDVQKLKVVEEEKRLLEHRKADLEEENQKLKKKNEELTAENARLNQLHDKPISSAARESVRRELAEGIPATAFPSSAQGSVPAHGQSPSAE